MSVPILPSVDLGDGLRAKLVVNLLGFRYLAIYCSHETRLIVLCMTLLANAELMRLWKAFENNDDDGGSSPEFAALLHFRSGDVEWGLLTSRYGANGQRQLCIVDEEVCWDDDEVKETAQEFRRHQQLCLTLNRTQLRKLVCIFASFRDLDIYTDCDRIYFDLAHSCTVLSRVLNIGEHVQVNIDNLASGRLFWTKS